ncbi:glycerol-3-phosphate dehydrogenase subunit GlpB [Nitratidesulfovibrio vulgaris]|uniref:Glycerol 3-phosphate dehydrogenase (Quinone) subunit B n=1 Tax=Nitratidesulfovibrio vulgaris (strain DP4) TaxID=391774 RepID=A0A0H3A860_NITV4|nr:glycerol-3-phosphate dehydrogenase subunit GlpB [Nitratidesulfovibrio vulgaris]ABM28249.1 glycerol 3-phosphate dehydrogenase (quinone) subunit B [Nitratidesulfovibrio vulgaris DP4]GEB80835.1 anaerobic glycerol-3-phosphate dehydrogenase subunit B [Desulfovibrio desulfuricans]
MSDRTYDCDLVVAGTGMAGMAAALFAARRGLSVVQAGSTGEIVFASGLFDVLGVHPMAEGRRLASPWEGMARLAADEPKHPYGVIAPSRMKDALAEFTGWLEAHGLPYRNGGDSNVRVLSPMGTVKTSWAVPSTMWAGVEALAEKKPCLLVDFEGLREYSARQIADTVGGAWPGLRTVRVEFPGTPMRPLLTGIMGQALELRVTREQLAEVIRPHLGDCACVGLPAILGIFHPGTVLAEMEAMLGVPVFEIPTLPASVPGLRLKNVFEGHIGTEGVDLMLQRKVLDVHRQDGALHVSIGQGSVERVVRARGMILATGRFLGHGLFAERDRIRETVLDLPVHQPAGRSQWHSLDLFDPAGHPVSRAGVVTDSSFRPVDEEGRVLHEDVRCVGTLLAHQDWMRQKCGVGLAVGSSAVAVDAFVAQFSAG